MDAEERATLAALQRFAESGSDLSRPMEIDFFVALPTEESAKSFSVEANGAGFKTSIQYADETADWTCYCSKMVVPSFSNVRAIEKRLNTLAQRFGGKSDGFGSFGNANADKI